MSDKIFRSRNFCTLLYPDDSTHKQALEIIKSNFDYAYILHDKDVYDEDIENDTGEHKKGDLKKRHWHVVFSNCSGNARTNKSIAKELGLDLNYIQQCRNLDNALLYLIHYNDDDKYQYIITDVVSNIYMGRLKNCINKCQNSNLSEADALNEITEHIYSLDKPVHYLYLINYCAQHGLSKYYRLYKYEFDSALRRQMAAIRYRLQHDDFKYGGSKYNIDNPDSEYYVDEDGFMALPEEINIEDIFPSKS